jgi:hypothetical protein
VLASLAHAAVLTRPAAVVRPSGARLEEIRSMDVAADGACASVGPRVSLSATISTTTNRH